MRSIDAKRALDKWLTLRGAECLKDSIHHTDGGSQYFSKLYLGIIERYKIRISVAKNCLENGYAEQRNGLIKYHFIPTIQSSSPKDARKQIDQIMYFYNHQRKQEALGWKSPVEYEHYIKGMTNKPAMKLYDHNNK